MTMATMHAQQPHPLHDPDARRTYMLAEIVRAFGLTFGMVAGLRALIEPSIASGVVGAVAVLVTILAARLLRLRAWESTSGAHGIRRWAAQPNPARLAGDGVMTVVVVVVGGAVLMTTDSPWATTVVAAFAAYFGVALACLFTRKDLARTAIRLTGPVAVLAGVTVFAALPQTSANVYSVAAGALLGCGFGVLAGVMVRSSR